MADRLISREEVLGGLPARRAGLTLFAIQSRTASLVARSRRAMATYLTPHAAAEREREFLAAMASGRELPLKPSIQDLERYADDWAGLVPADPGLRAAVARLLAEQHAIPRERVPRLRAALGLDEPAVREAFERANRRSPDSLYATELGRGERLRWARARAAERLERMPPFWTAFALTLTECVGAGILALPVAMAGIGPLGAVVVLVVFGLVNVVTVAALVEAITRTGAMRYGTAYFGRLVGDYLGAVGSATIAAAVFALNATVLLVALVGFGAVLEGSTGVPLAVWACILFAGNLVYLRREGLDATVASALVVGAVNIGLIVALSAIGLAHLDAGNFERVNVPLLDGRPVDTDVLVLIFGVVLLAFFGHTSAANSAKVVLERDPTGRALLWGNVAALLAATLLYALTVLAMTGAVAPADLQGSDGTALEPLAARAGAAVDVLGSAFAILAIGLGSIYCSLGLYNQMVEWRPEPDPRRRFLVGTLPAVAVLGVTLAMLAAGSQSFAGPLGYVGALTIPLLGGLFPMLLVVASRRRGELVPGTRPAARRPSRHGRGDRRDLRRRHAAARPRHLGGPGRAGGGARGRGGDAGAERRRLAPRRVHAPHGDRAAARARARPRPHLRDLRGRAGRRARRGRRAAGARRLVRALLADGDRDRRAAGRRSRGGGGLGAPRLAWRRLRGRPGERRRRRPDGPDLAARRGERRWLSRSTPAAYRRCSSSRAATASSSAR